MVADFASADYGWMDSPGGSQQAQVLFKAGKAQEDISQSHLVRCDGYPPGPCQLKQHLCLLAATWGVHPSIVS